MVDEEQVVDGPWTQDWESDLTREICETGKHPIQYRLVKTEDGALQTQIYMSPPLDEWWNLDLPIEAEVLALQVLTLTKANQQLQDDLSREREISTQTKETCDAEVDTYYKTGFEQGRGQGYEEGLQHGRELGYREGRGEFN